MKPMHRDIAAKQTQPPAEPGVIDSIADGLSLALARPWLLLVPVLLDLYYWAGWRLSAEGLTAPIRRWILGLETAQGAELADRVEQAGRADVSAFLSLLVPSLLGNAEQEGVYRTGTLREWSPEHWWSAGLVVIGALLGSALLLMIFSVPLADAVLNRSRSAGAVLAAIGKGWLRFLGLLIIAIGIALLLLVPIMIGMVALLLIGVNAAPLVGVLALFLGLFAFLALWFAPDAIVVSEVGPLRAIYYSFQVVRAYFWQTVGIAAASFLISIGLGQLWHRIADVASGLLLGVIASAFFAAGLAMASMVFYSSRIRTLQAVLKR